MYTITLHYPKGVYSSTAEESIRSSFVPQIGSVIYGSLRSGGYRVKSVIQFTENGITSTDIGVELEETD